MPYDIAIIGAGPAGCTLARLLDKKYKVLLLDKRDLTEESPAAASKCCGGLLAPDAQEMLGRLGLAVPAKVLVDPQLFLVRTFDFDNNLERYYQRFYFNMDRLAFERWLLESVPDHVDMAPGCTFKSCSRIREGAEFSFTFQGKTYHEQARVIVGADGAHSMVRENLFPNVNWPKNYIAIQEWFEIEKSVPWLGAIFDRTITDFYSWIITKGNILLIGSALEKDHLALDRFKVLKMKLRDKGLVYGAKIKREGSLILRPQRLNSICMGDEDSALVGEAAGFISPSSAEGISYALKSAYYLSNALNQGLDGFHTRYKKMTSSLKWNLRAKNLKTPGMYNSFIRKIVMKTGLKSTDVFF